MSAWALAASCLCGCTAPLQGCAQVPAKVVLVPTPAVERSIPQPEGPEAEGDAGLRARLSQAKDGERIELPAGELRGPFVLERPVTLVGVGPKTVLAGDARGAVVRVRRDGVRRERLALEGGRVGVRCLGHAQLVSVGLHRQHEVGLLVESGGVDVTDSEVTESGLVGVQAVDSRVDLTGVVMRLSGRRAIELKGGEARLSGVDLAFGRQTGLQAMDGAQVTVRASRFEHFVGNAIFAAAARVKLEDVTTRDSEYGVLASRGARVEVTGGEMSDYRVAGYALVNAEGALTGTHFARGGTEGAISLLQTTAPMVIRDVTADDPGTNGLHLTRAQVTLEGTRLTGARLDHTGDFGDGIYALESTVTVDKSRLLRNAGAGITVANGTLKVVDSELSDNGGSGAQFVHAGYGTVVHSKLSRNRVGLALAESSG
ncbi:MAG: right-handed parallel beta-helix repeat-containing protein, partial [Deltaproteobacteria bacterium]|nr:right-handed parallel beta-helix repeat-containing protein [Deltaproteobacteria bacterium]